MADTTELRHHLGPDLVARLAADVAAAFPAFDRDGFVADVVRDLDALSLSGRAAAIADALRVRLPPRLADALDVVRAALPPPDPSGGVEGYGAFAFWPHLTLVERHGLDEPELALDALGDLTRWFSAEFAVRPYLLRHADLALARLHAWAADPDWRVRRLASEGSRPRLPWGVRLPFLIRDPAPVLPVLDRLHDDPHPIVRRSVANHLNDLAKDHPELALDVAARWSAPAVVRHGLRTFVKQGHPRALALLGFSGAAIDLVALTLDRAVVRLGEALGFEVVLRSREPAPATLSVDYAVHYRKADGSLRPKVFKLAKPTLAPGATVTVTRRHRFEAFTTRRHHAGPHRLAVLVNGRVVGEVGFDLA